MSLPLSDAAYLAQLRCDAAECLDVAPGTADFDMVAAAVTYVWHATPVENRRMILLVGIVDGGEGGPVGADGEVNRAA